MIGEWFDRFDAMSSVPLLGLEMDMESRRNPDLARGDRPGRPPAAQDGVRVPRSIISDLVDRDPLMPVEELASSMIALSKAVSLARLTRHSTTLNTARAVRILMGMPTTA